MLASGRATATCEAGGAGAAASLGAVSDGCGSGAVRPRLRRLRPWRSGRRRLRLRDGRRRRGRGRGRARGAALAAPRPRGAARAAWPAGGVGRSRDFGGRHRSRRIAERGLLLRPLGGDVDQQRLAALDVLRRPQEARDHDEGHEEEQVEQHRRHDGQSQRALGPGPWGSRIHRLSRFTRSIMARPPAVRRIGPERPRLSYRHFLTNCVRLVTPGGRLSADPYAGPRSLNARYFTPLRRSTSLGTALESTMRPTP